MEAQDPLSDLADIHLPAAVPLWPPAPGWWVLAALVLAGFVALGVLLFRRWQQQQRLRLALQELIDARTAWQQRADRDALPLLATCNNVLKRVALVYYPAPQVASLSGKPWLQFLDSTGGADRFAAGPAQVLADAGYRRTLQTDEATVAAVLESAEQWIRTQYGRRPATALQEAA